MPFKDPEKKRKWMKDYYLEHKEKFLTPKPMIGRTKTGRLKRLNSQQKQFKKALESGKTIETAVKDAYKTVRTPSEVGTKIIYLAKSPILGITIEKYLEALSSQGINAQFLGKKYKQIIKKTGKGSNPHVDRNTLLAMESVEKLAGLRVERRETKKTVLHITSDELDLMLRLREAEIAEERKTSDSRT